MSKKTAGHNGGITAQPHFNQRAAEIQKYGTVSHALPLELAEPVRLEMTEHLNQLLADTMTLRDLYKKSHWQVAGPTFYQLHLLFDKHYGEQSELVDTIAERIQLLGGVSLAMAADVAETTQDRAAAARTRRSPSPTLTPAGRPQGHHRPVPRAGRAGGSTGRRWNQRPGGQRRSADQRIAGMVPERAPGAYAPGHCPGLNGSSSEIKSEIRIVGADPKVGPDFCPLLSQCIHW